MTISKILVVISKKKFLDHVISVEVFVIEKRRNIVEKRWIISNVERVDQGWSVFPKKLKRARVAKKFLETRGVIFLPAFI